MDGLGRHGGRGHGHCGCGCSGCGGQWQGPAGNAWGGSWGNGGHWGANGGNGSSCLRRGWNGQTDFGPLCLAAVAAVLVLCCANSRNEVQAAG
jgi:hypothetical protein